MALQKEHNYYAVSAMFINAANPLDVGNILIVTKASSEDEAKGRMLKSIEVAYPKGANSLKIRAIKVPKD